MSVDLSEHFDNLTMVLSGLFLSTFSAITHLVSLLENFGLKDPGHALLTVDKPTQRATCQELLLVISDLIDATTYSELPEVISEGSSHGLEKGERQKRGYWRKQQDCSTDGSIDGLTVISLFLTNIW